jgi:hypothetical protein
MTVGEYAFLTAVQTSAAGISLFGICVVAPIYLSAYQRIPPRMLKVMSEMSPADAERLYKSEMEPQPSPGYRLY